MHALNEFKTLVACTRRNYAPTHIHTRTYIYTQTTVAQLKTWLLAIRQGCRVPLCTMELSR